MPEIQFSSSPVAIDAALLAEVRQILAEETGQAAQVITDTQVAEYLELFWQEEAASPSFTALFEAQVQRNPDRIVLRWGEERWSYTDLEARANHLAARLVEKGVGPGVRVGIRLETSAHLPVAVLAVLKAGGACLPMEPEGQPTAGTRPSLLITEARFQAPGELLPTLVLEEEFVHPSFAPAPVVEIAPTDPAWIFYAEGREVVLSQAALAVGLEAVGASMGLRADDVALFCRVLNDPLAPLELLAPLVAGARLVLCAAAEPSSLQALVAGEEVSFLSLLPSELARLVLDLGGSGERLPSLRTVIVGGEPLVQLVVDHFLGFFGNVALYHFYAPLPAALPVCVHPCRLGEGRAIVPVGRALGWAAVSVVDSHEQPVPVGVVGEVWLFEEDAQGPPVRTGDRGRWLADGALELVGSTSRRIWHRGRRVDPAEVEAALVTSTLAAEATVLVRSTEQGLQQLIAYVVAGSNFSAEAASERLASLLPPFLRPDAYLPLTALPLTARGEVDEAALARFPLLDPELAERWESLLRTELAIEEVAVVVADRPAPPSRPLHLAGLLPAHRRSSAAVPVVVGPVTEVRSLPPAFADGGTLAEAPDSPTTLPGILRQAAWEAAERGIVYVEGETTIRRTYPQLLDEAERILAGLRGLGLHAGDRVILQLDRNADLLATFWGALLGGFLPLILPVAPSYSEANRALDQLCQAWELFEAPLIVTTEALQQALDTTALPSSTQDYRIVALEKLRQHEPDGDHHTARPEDPALLILSSGSTGRPKAVVLTHRNLLSRARGTNCFCGHTPSDIIFNWLPFEHVGSISDWHLRCVDLGCEMVYASKEEILGQPLRWLDLIDRYRVSHSWAPNFAYGLLTREIKQQPTRASWDLRCVRTLLSAGEPVAPRVVVEFVATLTPYGLADAAIQAAFGMAELGSGITYSKTTAADRTYRLDQDSLGGTVLRVGADHPRALTFSDLGAPIPGVTLRIVDARNELLPEETVGRLQVRGEAVFAGYYRDLERSREVLLEGGWFDTGDLGFLSGGHLVITGRAKETIILNGANFYSHEIELTIEMVEGVEPSYTAACAVREPGGVSDRLAVFFASPLAEGEPLAQLLTRICEQAARQLGVAPDYLVRLEKGQIPKTAIGKIQRTQLRQRLEAGEFDRELEQADLLLANERTLPNWFYRKVWQPRPVTEMTRWAVGPVALFIDESGLGAVLAEALAARREVYVRIEAGESFERPADYSYRIDPSQPGDYDRLLAALAEDGLSVRQFVHLWGYGPAPALLDRSALEAASRKGVFSLLFLVQAFERRPASGSARLLVVSSHTQALAPGELTAPERSLALGLVRTIPQEIEGLTCGHIDLASDTPALAAQALLRELSNLTVEPEVVYRGGQRLVARLEKLEVAPPLAPPPLRPGGFYLLTGGLGGIGAVVARTLLERYGARLLIVGRRSSLEAAPALRTLEGLGGLSRYAALDVGDAEALKQAVRESEAFFGASLDGVFHLAGVAGERSLVEETPESFAAVLRAKVEGTLAIDELLSERPGNLFVAFSSAVNFLGGATLGAYAAANHFLESYCNRRRAEGFPHSYCFDWGPWEGIGLSRALGDHLDSLHERGLVALSPRQGIDSLLVALASGEGHLLVGLDGHRPALRRFLRSGAVPTQQMIAYYALRDGTGIAMDQTAPADRFGAPSGGIGLVLPSLPRLAEGGIDRSRLKRAAEEGFDRPADTYVGPRTDLERQMADLWQAVLGVNRVSVYDNFFKLGGTSLMLTQVASRIRSAFQVELPLQELFGAPTVVGMTTAVVRRKAEQQDQTKLAQMLKYLETLTPEQVKALLGAKGKQP